MSGFPDLKNVSNLPVTGILITPQFFGEMWKVNDNAKKCTEIKFPTSEKCENEVCDAG